MNFFNESMRLNRLMIFLGFFCLCFSWIFPNKSYPWLSAWNEGWVFISIGILCAALLIFVWKRVISAGISWPLLWICILSILIVWLQWLDGVLIFRGDAVLVTLYFGFFFLSIWVACGTVREVEKIDWIDGFMTAIIMAGLVTVTMSLIQWTAVYDLVIFVQDAGRHGRPFANLGQINHVNTLCFVAACAVLQLHAKHKIHTVVMLASIVLLTFGMALSQSRTAVVQVLVLWVWSVWQSRSHSLVRNTSLILVLAYVLWAALFPHLASMLYLEPGRSMQLEANSDNLRFKAWAAMLEAVAQRPWAGYGWLQTALAQQSVALEHTGLRYEFNYSHNFVVDLLIWVGIPLGIALTALLAWWGWCHAKSRNYGITFLMAALLGIMVHGLLEYPLSYAYFLLPAGLLMGSIDALNPVIKMWSVSKSILFVVLGLLIILSLAIGKEYRRAVETDVLMRMEASRLGVAGKTTPPPHFVLLDQLEGQFQFRFIDPAPGMNVEQLALMERVARRYATLPILMDLALAKSMNGDALGAMKNIDIACAIYGERVCERNLKEWSVRRDMAAGRIDIYAVPFR